MTINTEGPKLKAWLKRIEAIHPDEIELGLTRVKAVAKVAGLDKLTCPLITIAGTNGKGSVVSFLTAIYVAAGYKVGSYTSPHISRFNERIRLNGRAVEDEQIVSAFNVIESKRGECALTYFEYSTLASMHLFLEQNVDVVLMEVGLGGRLDAVNIWDADVAVVTTIAIDHESWLGTTREEIAIEKVAIARSGKTLVTGDRSPPASLFHQANTIGAQLLCIGADFDYSSHSKGWDLNTSSYNFKNLQRPSLKGHWQYDNAAVAIVASHALTTKLPVELGDINKGLETAVISARYQHAYFSQHPIILDVGHNPAAVKVLSEQLKKDYPAGVAAVFAVMQDKAVGEIIDIMGSSITHWFIGSLSVERALDVDELEQQLSKQKGSVEVSGSVLQALERAVEVIPSSQPILIFGSFFTISAVMEFID
jgi:dihydrofolate synthase/folylpolyglutamate synthase